MRKEIMMKKLSALLVACILTSIISGCVFRPVMPLDEAQAAYCQDLMAYKTAVDNVQNLPTTATVDDFQAAMKTVEDSHDELQNSAWELADSQTAALQDQYDQITENLDSINDETTLAAARTVVSTSVESAKSTWNEVMHVSCETNE